MLEKLKSIEDRYDEINHQLEETAGDYQKATELAKERAELEPIVMKSRSYQVAKQRMDEARELIGTNDEDLRQLADSEIKELEPLIAQLEADLRSLLIPKDPRDDRNVFVEIRAGTGGDEAALFAADLMHMYVHYAERKRWHIEMMSASETGVGGFKEVIFSVKGKGAYSKLKYESGVHRVQRVPATEAQGRIHTSTATVVVLAEVEDIDIHIPESDYTIDVYKSAGAGGQNVQKNSTAVRLTHIPSGIVVACQDERSQLQNRLRAMSILRARLYDLEVLKRQTELEETRRSQVGSGERSEKIRTYNYPQSRVTDHRINISNFNLPSVMAGDLDLFIDELNLRSETERLTTTETQDDDD